MISSMLDLYLIQIIEKILFGGIIAYFVFSVIVLRQTRLLVSTVETNLSRLVLGIVLANLIIGLLGVIAAASLVL